MSTADFAALWFELTFYYLLEKFKHQEKLKKLIYLKFMFQINILNSNRVNRILLIWV